MYVREHGNRKHSFFISWIFYQLTNLCNCAIQLKQISGICKVKPFYLVIKMWFPFNFAKNLKDRDFVVGRLKTSGQTFSKHLFGVSFQKNVLSSLLLFLSVCYQDDLSDSERNGISAARNFNNSWLLYVKFSETINLCRNIWLIEKVKMSAVFILEIKAKKDKIFNILNGCFSVTVGSMDMIFGLFSETYVRLLKI